MQITNRKTGCRRGRGRTRRVLGVCGVFGALAVGGCGAFSKSDKAYARPYPAQTDRGEVLDVQVFRQGTKLKMTNTTARSFGAGTLWVNQRFCRPIEGFGAGETLTVNLYDFRDQYQDQFRAGGFFATRDPDPVVLVELETGGDAPTTGTMYGFVVVRNEMN